MFKVVQINGKQFSKPVSPWGTGLIETKISDKISPINRDEANSELERGEIVLDGEKLSLHKVLGNKHSNGGTPVNLPDKSFVFSDYTKLSIPNKTKELFELKTGGSFRNSTPSKVLSREIDIKHHNNMVNIVGDEKNTDEISKTSAMLMLQKNIEKVGQIAYIQEMKKRFPNGVPEFSNGTAPVYSDKVDDEISRSTQYMQSGGLIDWMKSNGYSDVSFKNRMNLATKYGIPNYIGTANQNNALLQKLQPNNLNIPGGWSNRVDEIPGVNIPFNQTSIPKPSISENPLQSLINKGIISGANGPLTDELSSLNGVKMGNDSGKPSYTLNPTNYNVGLTPWQMFNIAKPQLDALNIKKRLPTLQQVHTITANDEELNASAQTSMIDRGVYAASKAMSAINPYIASSVISQMYGDAIDKKRDIIGNLQNANSQIRNANTQRYINALNSDAVNNSNLASKFNDQLNMVNENVDRQRQYLNNQSLSIANDYIAQNQAFNNYLNSQQQFKTNEQVGTNPDGTPIYRAKSLYEPVSNGFGYNTKLSSGLAPDIMSMNFGKNPDNLAKRFKDYADLLQNSNLDANTTKAIMSIIALENKGVNPSYKIGGQVLRPIRKYSKLK